MNTDQNAIMLSSVADKLTQVRLLTLVD